jgi:hypothetical protein
MITRFYTGFRIARMGYVDLRLAALKHSKHAV